MKKATLNAEENSYWEFCFSTAIEDGMTEEEADQAAWQLTVVQFPRLANYEGAEA
jgi:hypothetical protein